VTDKVRVDLDRLNRGVSDQDANSSTAVLYGAAGACLAIVLLIAQIGTGSQWLLSSLVLASIALPVFTALALSEQVVNGMKVSYQPAQRFTPTRKMQVISGLLAFGSLLASIGCIITSFSPLAGGIFLVAILSSFLLAVVIIGVAGLNSGVLKDASED
jgi:hypothetical protein